MPRILRIRFPKHPPLDNSATVGDGLGVVTLCHMGVIRVP